MALHSPAAPPMKGARAATQGCLTCLRLFVVCWSVVCLLLLLGLGRLLGLSCVCACVLGRGAQGGRLCADCRRACSADWLLLVGLGPQLPQCVCGVCVCVCVFVGWFVGLLLFVCLFVLSAFVRRSFVLSVIAPS